MVMDPSDAKPTLMLEQKLDGDVVADHEMALMLYTNNDMGKLLT